MRKNHLSRFRSAALGSIVLLFLLSYEVPFKVLVPVHGSYITPVKILLEGELKSGSITEGTIFITSGTVTIDRVLFRVSEAQLEGFNDSMNYVATSQGKLSSNAIGLGKSYVMVLAANYTADNDTLYLNFGYGDAYPGSSAISRSYGRPVLILINATGTLKLSDGHVEISAQGRALLPRGEEEEGLQDVCIVVIRKEAPNDESFSLSPWGMWGMGVWEDDENYYVPVPKGSSVTVFGYLSPGSRLAGLLSRYGAAFSSGQGVLMPFTISCDIGNTSLALLEVERLKLFLGSFVSEERSFLLKVGFDAEKYFKEVDYAVMLLEESEAAYEKSEAETGSGLFEKSILKVESALEALSQAKSDCIAMFIFLTTFTFFISSIASAMIGKRRRLTVVGLFGALTLAEVAFIPQAKMAIALLNPEVVYRLSSTSIALSLFTAIVTLVIVGMLILEAKGTLLSDLFWYSVKSMQKRALRATLTILTIAVVSGASGSLLAIGTLVTTREATYSSEFHGLSISSHVTTAIYIFRGMDQKNEYIVNEVFEPLPDWQVKWLSNMEGVEKVYVVAVSQALVSKDDKMARVFLVATNASALNGTMVSADLAERIGAEEGDLITIMGGYVTTRRVNVVLREPLKLADGVPFDEVEGPLVVVGLESLPQLPAVYRLLLEGNFSNDFVKRLVETSYEKHVNFTTVMGSQITTHTFRSFRASLGTGSETECLLIVGEFQQFTSVPELAVLIGLSSLMIMNILLGSLYERQGEYSTASTLGASPGHISLLLIVEGLSYGLLGGVMGYVLSQFLQAYVSTPVTLVKPYVFSSLVASFLVATLSSLTGGLIPARKVVLKVVPSKLMFKRIEEVKLFKDHAEAVIPLRVVEDVDDFVDYVSSFTKRTSPRLWGPAYMQASPIKEGERVSAVEMTLSYRGERVAMYKIRLILPDNPGKTLKALAYSATGQWGVDHKFCARQMLTVLREDLLQYVDWKGKRAH